MNFISTSGIPSVNRIIDLQALNLAGPTVTRMVSDPQAVLSLYNRLFIKPNVCLVEYFLCHSSIYLAAPATTFFQIKNDIEILCFPKHLIGDIIFDVLFTFCSSTPSLCSPKLDNGAMLPNFWEFENYLFLSFKKYVYVFFGFWLQQRDTNVKSFLSFKV